MFLYLDASILASLFVADAFSDQASSLLAAAAADVLISDFAATEFSSVIARQVRMGRLSVERAREGFADFDVWNARAGQKVATLSADIQAAGTLIRRLDLNIRAPDALHIAVALRLGATLATFDRQMSQNAQSLGLEVVPA